MKISLGSVTAAVSAGIATALLMGGAAAQGQPTPEQVLAAVKQNLQDSQARLRKYEWVETTAISLKGEEKSRKRQRVYYGADGKLMKVPMDAPAAKADAQGGGGGRGGRLKKQVVENKVEDMKEYMERAAALIHSYVPPNPASIQKAKDAGKLKVVPAQQGRVRAEFPDFNQPSDLLSIEIDPAAGRLGGITVASYLDEREDAVTLAVQYAALADSTSYVARTTLEAKAKNIRVVVENAGHRPLTTP